MNFDYNVTPLYRKDSLPKIEVGNFKPIITIVTPFYNSGKYIEDTATLVLNQTFPWFEWIIVDDGSKDKESLEILDKVRKLDGRIKVFHKKNEGLAATRDYGASKSSKSAKFLLFLDDDDLIELNFVECLYYSLITNKEASFAYTNTVGFGEMNYLWDVRFNAKREKRENILVATALIRKEDFFEVGGYGLKEKGINEDWIFWLKSFANNKVPLRLNYYGFWYRRKETGELKTASGNRKRTLELLAPYAEKMDNNLKFIEYPKDNYDWNESFDSENVFKVISNTESNKTNIIMIMPHIVMGGADKFNIDFLKGLNKKYSVTAIFTNVSDNGWLSEIKKYVDSYYILPAFLDRKYWHYFLEYLINKNHTKLIFNTNSVYGYMALPYLKSKFEDIKILDYIHMEEWYNRNGGYSRDSSSVSSVIDKTLVCNRNSEKILINHFNRNKNDVETVYIGVDEKKFEDKYTKEEKDLIKEKYNIPKNKKIITFIARIDYQKRPFLLIEIIKEYIKDYDEDLFLVCGDGPLLDNLKQMASEYNLNNNVLFLGSIKDTKEIYAISDCTLNCSIKEGLALTTYESLSMGVPVVSSNVGGQSEIIDKTVGFVIETKQAENEIFDYNYDENEINEYVISLRKVLQKNKIYKSNCRKKVLSGFTINQMNDKMNLIIDTLIKNKSKKSFENEDIAKELLNQYLLNSKGEFEYFERVFKEKYEYYTRQNFNMLDKFRNYTFKYKGIIRNMAIKLHIYNEVKFIGIAFKGLITFIVYLILLPIYMVKRILNIIKYRIKWLFNR